MSEAGGGFVREAYEVLEDLDRQSTVEGVIGVTRRALTRFGFDYFCFNTFPNDGQRFEDVTIAVQVPHEWLRIYLEEDYVRIDPSIRHCQRMVRPFRWIDSPYDPEREPEVVAFLKRSADFALSNGFWFPIPGRRGTIGGVWLGGDRAEVPERDLPLLHLISLSAFELLRRLQRQPNVIPLTPASAKSCRGRRKANRPGRPARYSASPSARSTSTCRARAESSMPSTAHRPSSRRFASGSSAFRTAPFSRTPSAADRTIRIPRDSHAPPPNQAIAAHASSNPW
jgi:LuxR family quorum sensing-dependent transcriptional regulator